MKIALFHSALGLRAIERDLAAMLRGAGYDAVVPDLYDGLTADTLAEGLALKDQVGWTHIASRARQAARDLPPDTVLMGVSMGAGVVSELWRERPSTPAVILIHGYCEIPDDVPAGVRVALHVAVGDPFAPEPAIAAWQVAARARGIAAEIHRYPDAGHFFSDRDSVDYDEQAAESVRKRVLSFLAEVDRRPSLTRSCAITKLPAQDLERARAFYRDKLGLEPVEERERGLRYCCAQGEFHVFLSTGAASGTSTQLGFEVEDIDATVAELRRRGVLFEEVDAPGFTAADGIVEVTGNYPSKGTGERGAFFRDSEGNLLALGEATR